MFNNKTYFLAVAFAAVLISALSCNKLVPEDRDALGMDTQFTQTVYEPVLGRTTVMNDNFYSGFSTIPLTFKIVNPRLYDGSAAAGLLDTFPVLVWKKAYTGEETSIDEIQAKRTIEYHPLFEIGKHSGTFTLWSSARSPFIVSQPDSGYIFDVEASNSGGRVYYRDIRLKPLKEQPYLPSNINQRTGQATVPNVYPSVVNGIYGQRDIRTPLNPLDIHVFFHKNGDGNSLTFKFLDTLSNPIDPAKFKDTDWKHLVHGFDMQMTPDSVKYTVAYPIPLVTEPTRYTTIDGRQAQVNFTYHRLGFGGVRQDARLALNFNIFEKGDWEIVFWFKGDNPNFEDDK